MDGDMHRLDDHLTDEGLASTSTRFERQKQRILDAATLALNQKGVWGMTLQEVAGALDLTTSSVTYYFKRREQLAAAVFEDTLMRLAAVAARAAQEPTARRRVDRYIELYFDQSASALLGQSRPFASLSEIRSLEEGARSTLIGKYQDIFRTVRSFFGESGSESTKQLFTARAHILNEALFWSDVWLGRYAISDFPNLRRRLLCIFDGGLATAGTQWSTERIDLNDASDSDDQQAFLRVATRLINDFGYKGTSVKRITTLLNRTKTSFYRHIERKDELVAACSRHSHHRLAAIQARAAHCHSSAWKQATYILNSALALQFLGEFPLLRSSALQAMPGPVRTTAINRFDRTAFALMGLLVDAMREGSVRIVDPLIASHVILSSIDASYDLKGWRKKQTLALALKTYMSVLAHGLFDPD